MRSHFPNKKKDSLSPIHAKKPKQRRKLIEKYFTRRYNVNTKLVKVTPKYERGRKILHAVKLEQRNGRRCSIKLSNLPNLSQQIENEVASTTDIGNRTSDPSEVDARSPKVVSRQPSLFQDDSEATKLDSCNQKTKLDFEHKHEVKSDEDVPLHSSVCYSDISINVPDFMRGEVKTLKFVPLEFYSYLAKQVNTEKSPGKPVKKRKKLLKAPKKRNNQVKKNIHLPLQDPYLENWENLSSPIHGWEKNAALIVHLGVGRPLFPVIHRNIITMCLEKDTEITDMWAEFSLSTLITQPSDRHAKSVLMPVVDDQLLAAVSDFNQKWNVDFHEVEVRKVKLPRPRLPTNDEEELSLQTFKLQDQKKKARSSMLQRNLKKTINLKKTRKPISIIQQIYIQSLKNQKKSELLENSVLEKSSKSLYDEECNLQKFGFRPCWVAVPRLEETSFVGENDMSKLANISPSESIISNKKEPTACILPKKKTSPSIMHPLSISPKEKELTNENSTMLSSSHPLRDCTSIRLSFNDEKSPLSSLNNTAYCQPITTKKKPATQNHRLPILSSNETACPPSVSAKNKIVSRSQMLPIPSLNETASSPFSATNKRSSLSSSEEPTCAPPTKKRVVHSDQKISALSRSIMSTSSTAPEKTSAFLCQNVSASIGREQKVPVNQVEVINPLVEYEDTEWISMDHYFDLQHCSRTYGPILDYKPRNKTLVYFFKMRRILKFQTKNNKYFQSCSYLRIQRSMEDDFVDVLTEVEDTDEVEVLCNGHKPFKDILKDKGLIKPLSSNPLEILKFPKLSHLFGFSIVKDIDNQSQYSFHSIEKGDIQNLSNTKWIILRLDEDIVEIVYNKKSKIPTKLLFDIMYRADLTKRIIGHTIEITSSGSVSLYGIPGMCDAVILGPCQTPERCNSLSAIFQCDFEGTRVIDIPITTFRKVFTQNQPSAHNIEAVWWRPVNVPLKVTNINAAYLNFLFKWCQNPDPENQNSKLRLSAILRKHQAANCARYIFEQGDENFVLTHDPTKQRSSSSTTVIDMTNRRQIQKKSLKADEAKKSLKAGPGKLLRAPRKLSAPALPHCDETNQSLPNKSSQSDTEKLQQTELRRNRAFLNSLCSLVKEAVGSIGILNKKNVELLKEKEVLMCQRRELITKYVLLLKSISKKCDLYQMSRLVIPKLLLPRHAERAEKEEQLRIAREEKCYSMQMKTSIPRRCKKKRKTRKKVTNPEEKQEYSKSHVTVQSGDHIIGLGPYTEHNYCNFVGVNSSAGTTRVPLAAGSTQTSFKQNDGEKNDGVIHICVTEKGRSIFKLAITRLSDPKVRKEDHTPNTGVELKKLIQRILQQIQCKLNEDGLKNEKEQNHVHMLHKIVSDTRNEKLFLEGPFQGNPTKIFLDDVVSIGDKDYAYRVQHSDGKTPFLAEKSGNNTNRIGNSELEFSRIADAKNKYSAEKFVSINKLIAERTKVDEKMHQLSKNDGRASCVSSTNTKKLLLPDSVVMPEECVIEEQCVENNLNVEKGCSSRKDGDFWGSRVSVGNNVIVARKQASPMGLQYSRSGLRTVPILRQVYDGNLPQTKTVPLILRRPSQQLPVNARVFSKRPNPPLHMRCPSFVPVASPALSDLECRSVKDGKQKSKSSSEDAANLCFDLEENSDCPLPECTNVSKSRSVEISTNHGAKAESDVNENRASAPFRLSVKSFASLDAFTSSNVDKLLK